MVLALKSGGAHNKHLEDLGVHNTLKLSGSRLGKPKVVRGGFGRERQVGRGEGTP